MPPKQATLSKFFQPSVGKAGNQKKDAEPTALPDHAGIDNLSDLVSTQSTRDALTTALHNHFGEDQRDREQESAKLCDSANIANYTPLEKQVVQIKKTHPDCLLMIECGYRTRFFGEDAKNASKVLGIHARHDHSFLVASVPTYRSLFHCRRLIKAGHKVAMIRQQETAAIRKTKGTPSKSTFDRVVAGIFSAGTMIDDDDPAFRGICVSKADANTEDDAGSDADGADDDGHDDIAIEDAPSRTLDDGEWICTIYDNVGGNSTAMVAVNIVANKLSACLLPTDRLGQGIKDRLDQYRCCEVVVNDSCSAAIMKIVNDRLTASSSSGGEDRFIKRLVPLTGDSFLPSQLPQWAAGFPDPMLCALQGMFSYLQQFNLQEGLDGIDVAVEGFDSAGSQSTVSDEATFQLDGVTARDLEVFRSSHFGGNAKSTSSLMKNIDHCRTGYGRRTLRSWLSFPLKRRQSILERQAVVTTFATLSSSNPSNSLEILIRSCQGIFSKYPDTERSMALLQHGRSSFARIRILLQFAQSIAEIAPFTQIEENEAPLLLVAWIKSVEWAEIGRLAQYFVEQLTTVDDADSLTGVFSATTEQSLQQIARFRDELAEAHSIMQNALEEARGALGLPNLQFSTLRTGATSRLEYLVEVPVSFAKPIPDSWIKVSATKHLMRFHTPAALAAQDQIHAVRDRIKFAAEKEWQKYVETIKKSLLPLLHSAIAVLGRIDAALSLAAVARRPGYLCPLFPEDCDEVSIVAGKHPVLAMVAEDAGCAYVTNDVFLRRNFQDRRCQVITGPNMGGKSTYVRMVGILCLLAQIGSYIPAEQARMCVFDNIFTRMGAEDDLTSGRSTFMCELIRVSNILRSASSRSLVVIDELGRGTSTYDGCAIALSTLAHLIQHIGCALLFITHFPQVSEYVDSCGSDSGVNTHMSYVEEVKDGRQEVIFLYTIAAGASKGSYGINVARLAGLPESVLLCATKMSQSMLGRGGVNLSAVEALGQSSSKRARLVPVTKAADT